jgi:phage baseplate assembly protein gpV
MPAASLNRAAVALAVAVEVVAVAAVVVSEDVVVAAEVVVVVAVAVAVAASALVLTALLPPSLVPRSLSIKRGLMRNSCGPWASGGVSNKWAFVGCRFNTS